MVLFKDIHKTQEDLLNKDWYVHAGASFVLSSSLSLGFTQLTVRLRTTGRLVSFLSRTRPSSTAFPHGRPL
jgi:hypothetical protein